MKKRHLYALLFLIPGFFLSALAVGAAFAVVAGALWLFVFGDDSWPAWTDSLIPGAMLIAFLCLWVGSMVAGYRVGKKLEPVPGFDSRHLWMSLGATLLPIAVLFLHQLSIGNLAPKTDSQRCREYCRDLGYDTSSMPPRNSDDRSCRCLGAHGAIEQTVPIDELSRQ